jgi:hypothetical protein
VQHERSAEEHPRLPPTAALYKKGKSHMKRFIPRIPGAVVVVFALCSIGADSSSSGCKSSSQSNKMLSTPKPTKPWCHNDPPIFCAAYCGDVDLVMFNERCYDVGRSILAVEFEARVKELYQERFDLGESLCTGYDPYNYVTPCQVFITPQEHPDQDHEFCEPVPAGCPMP